MASPPPPRPPGASAAAKAALAVAVLALVGGAYVVGRGAGRAGDAPAQPSARPAPDAAGTDERVALLEALQEKQAGIIDQQQKLLDQSQAVADSRVKIAEALRENVELSSTLLLFEAREGLGRLGRLETVERAARTALEPYENREPDALGAMSLEVKVAATTLLGDVLFEQGRLAEAKDVRRQAIALQKLRLSQQPTKPGRVLGLATAHEALADALDAGADAGGALAEREEALRHFRALSDAEPQELLWLGALADALSRTSGTLATLGRRPEARAHAEQAVQLARALRSKEHGEARWARVLARALGALAARLAEVGGKQPKDVVQVRVLYEEASLLLEPPGGGVDADAERAGERADLLLARGAWEHAQGASTEAIEALRASLDAAVDVVNREPLARTAQERVARVCSLLAAALEAGGEDDDARQGRAEAVAAWRRVSALDPGREEPKRELLRALLAWGDIHTRQERLDQALASYHEALALTKTLAAAPPDEAEQVPLPSGPGAAAGTRPKAAPRGGSDLAEAHDRVATTLLALGRRPEALQAWRDALVALERPAKETPENAFWQADLARIWMNLGNALKQSEPDREEGERALKRALRILTGLEEKGRLPAYARGWVAGLRETAAK